MVTVKFVLPYIKELEFFFCDKSVYHVEIKRQKKKEKRKNLSVLAVKENGKTEERKFVNNFHWQM